MLLLSGNGRMNTQRGTQKMYRELTQGLHWLDEDGEVCYPPLPSVVIEKHTQRLFYNVIIYRPGRWYGHKYGGLSWRQYYRLMKQLHNIGYKIDNSFRNAYNGVLCDEWRLQDDF